MKWPTYPLSKIATDLQPGFARQPEFGDTTFPQLRTHNVSPEGRIDLTLVKEVPVSQRESEYYSLQKGDVLFNNTNSAELVGKTAFFDVDGGPYLFSNHMTRVRVNQEVAEPRFIARYLFWTWKIGGFRMMITRWVNQAAINKTTLGGLRICLPPLSEQRRIVEILDQVDALQKRRAAADAKAARILPALFYKMFGDSATNSTGLPVRKLGKLIEEPTFGLSKALSGKTEQEPGTTPILRMANITSDGFLDVSDLRYDKIPQKSMDRYTVKKFDLLFNWRNSPKWIGKTAIFDLDGSYSYASFLFRLRVKQGEADYRYLWQFLNSLVSCGWFTQKCRQAVSQANFGRDELADIEVPYPDLQKQVQFGEAYDRVRVWRRLSSSSRTEIERIFRLLLHHAFSGDLTAKWREAHMKELLEEMEAQAKALDISAA